MFESWTAAASAPAGDFGDVSGVLLAHLLGSTLADLEAVPDTIDGDAELVDACVGLARLEAWAVAQRARVTSTLVTRTRAELTRHGLVEHGDSRGTSAGAAHGYDDERLAERTVSTDLSLALGITPWAADRELHLATRLDDHPELGIALAAGRLDRRRTELVLEEVAVLDTPQERQHVLCSVVGDGSHSAEQPDRRPGLIRPLKALGSHLQLLQPATLRRAVRQECAALDPDLFAKRESAARGGRHVEHAMLPDAMAELRVVAPGYAIAAAVTNIDQAARAARRRGDFRTLDQLRCDITIGWVTEGAFGTLVTRPRSAATAGTAATMATMATTATMRLPLDATAAGSADEVTATFDQDDLFRVELSRPPAALIVISMADRTALGLDDSPATLHGPDGASPMPAAVARQIAYDPSQATWLGLYTDPRTGVATDISPGYRPPPRQRTFVMLRDGLRSRLPSSNVRRVELDHVVPYDHDHPARGGQTTPADLACAGLREHRLKTDRMLSIAGDAGGPLTYTTHTRHHYVSWPELWSDPPSYTELTLPTRSARETSPPAQRATAVGDPPY